MEIKRKPRAKADEFKRARSMTKKLTCKLEEMLKSGIPEDEEQRGQWQKTYDLLFGAKHPLIDTLATLVDLTVELEKAGKPKSAKIEPQAEEYSFTASDVALVKSFIEKSTHSDA